MDKFSLTPINEVHLERAPLVKVLMQVQYSRTPELVTDAAESGIADTLGRYPVRRRQLVAGPFPSLLLNGQPVQLPAGVSPGATLQFANPSASWQVSVADRSVSLETTEYHTRDDFSERVLEILQAIADISLPPVVDRVGVRYINRLTGHQLRRVGDLVIPQLETLSNWMEEPLTVHHSVTDSLIELSPAEQLRARSGLLPSGVVFDPSLQAIQEPSWVLDIDVYTTRGGFAFEAEELAARLRRYSEVAYAFFRFATTEEFLHEHRGEAAQASGDGR